MELNRSDIFGGGSITTCDTFNAISQWCDRHQSLFDMADVVVIEKQFIDAKLQLSLCLATVQCVLQCRSYKRHILVHAGTIKRIYSISRGNHRLNKQASIECAVTINPSLFAGVNGKLNDMADCYLLAHYATTHFSESYVSKFKEFSKSVLTRKVNGGITHTNNSGPQPNKTGDAGGGGIGGTHESSSQTAR